MILIVLWQGGWTPLVWSSYKGHGQIVKELLGHGADPNEKGQVGVKSCQVLFPYRSLKVGIF